MTCGGPVRGSIGEAYGATGAGELGGWGYSRDRGDWNLREKRWGEAKCGLWRSEVARGEVWRGEVWRGEMWRGDERRNEVGRGDLE